MKILLVDDDSKFVDDIKSAFSEKVIIDHVSTVESAIKKIEAAPYDLIITNWMLPMSSGKKLLDWCHDNEQLIQDTKVWVNSPIPTDRIKKYTNGSRIFNKLNNQIMDAIQEESKDNIQINV